METTAGMQPVRMSTVSSRSTAGLSYGILLPETRGRFRADPFPKFLSSGVHAPGNMEGRPPICRSLRNAELARQPPSKSVVGFWQA
jgi:hypothetical protein